MSTRTALDTAGVDRVVVCGDWHGAFGWGKAVIRAAADQGIHTLVHVGDFGIGPWGKSNTSMTRIIDADLTRHGSQLFVSPGNHDNHDRISIAKRDTAGLAVLGLNLRALPFGARIQIGARTFGALGGAVSVDKSRRVPGQSWWPQEAPTAEHVYQLGADHLDVLITHDVPMGPIPVRSGMRLPLHLQAETDDVRRLLAQAVYRTHPQVVFSGHWHQRVTGALRGPDGWFTRVEVLDKELTRGNAVVLDLADLSTTPLTILDA